MTEKQFKEEFLEEMNEIKKEKPERVTVDDIIGLIKTDEPINGVEEVRKLRGRETEKRLIKGKIDEARFEKFEKIPVVVEAYQTDEEVEIETLEGVMKANKGDWIIKGVKGELYPCKPDVFEMTYEKVDGDD